MPIALNSYCTFPKGLGFVMGILWANEDAGRARLKPLVLPSDNDVHILARSVLPIGYWFKSGMSLAEGGCG